MVSPEQVSTVFRSIVRGSILTNVVGVAVVYSYLQFVAPGAYRNGSILDGVISLVAVVVYLVVALAVNVRVQRPPALFRGPGQDLSANEQRTVLTSASSAAAWVLGSWWCSIPLFVALNIGFGTPAGSIARIAVGILLGGMMTAAATYLIAERQLRGLVAVVLAGSPATGYPGPGIRSRLMLGWVVSSGVPMVAIALSPLARRGHADLTAPIIFLAAAGLGAGSLITRSVASAVTEPLTSIRMALDQVGRGSLDVQVPVDDSGEIGTLESGLNRMISGLRERERLQDLFGRHVGEAVALQALSTGNIALGGEQIDVSVLFVDLIGSTALATELPAPKVVEILNALFSCIVRAVDDEGGLVNKFEGDAALCIFGAPIRLSDHASHALRAARAMRALLVAEASNRPGLDAAIGVSTGEVVAGNIGTLDRYEYTVIGDPVNEAARLTELAKTFPARILASSTVVGRAGPAEAELWNVAGEQLLRGRREPTSLMTPG